jgi:serine/threonine-protein kinase RsbW
MSLAADPAALAGVRAWLRDWLVRAGADEAEIGAIELAADEACTNAVRHSGTSRPVEATALLDGGVVEIGVRDFGRWRPRRADDDGGRGLVLIDALTDRAEISTGREGTTVRMWRRLGAPVA